MGASSRSEPASTTGGSLLWEVLLVVDFAGLRLGLDSRQTVLYAVCMSRYSSDFVQTVALITARAMARWRFLTPDEAVGFAWYSCNEIGDASIDNADLQRHFECWLADVHNTTLPAWMIGS